MDTYKESNVIVKLEELPGYQEGDNSIFGFRIRESKGEMVVRGGWYLYHIVRGGWNFYIDVYEDYFLSIDVLEAEKGNEKVSLMEDGTTFSATSEEAFKEVWWLLGLETGISPDVYSICLL